MGNDRKSFRGRRTFLRQLIGSLPLVLAAMATVFRRAFSFQDIQNPSLATIRPADTPGLDKPGGFVLVKNTSAGDVLIVCTGEGRYVAMSDICPHKQCRVEVKTSTLIKCPCHGSAYKIDGTYVSGPSHKSLKQFRLTLKDGTITVTEG